jgi:hypothetical protein
MTAMIGDSSFRAPGKGTRPARSAGERTTGEIRDISARRRLARADRSVAAVLTPLLGGPRPTRVWVVAVFLLEAIARDTLGDPEAAERALQHALDLAEPDQMLSPFLSHPSPGLLGRHDQHPEHRRNPDLPDRGPGDRRGQASLTSAGRRGIARPSPTASRTSTARGGSGPGGGARVASAASRTPAGRFRSFAHIAARGPPGESRGPGRR